MHLPPHQSHYTSDVISGAKFPSSRIKYPSNGLNLMNSSPFSIGTKQRTIHKFLISYLVDPKPLDAIETVQILVRLPFCLYVPSTRYLFIYPNSDASIGIVPEKIWTERSKGSNDPSPELVVATESVHLADGELITDWIGQPTAHTGEFQAINMEFDRDPSGYFRYTRLTVEFDWEVPFGYLTPGTYPDGSQDFDITSEMSARVLPFVNHFVDLYRYVTGDVYIEGISVPVIEDIRIGLPDQCNLRKQKTSKDAKLTYKHGFHPQMLGTHGIRPAMVSKPKEDIDSFRALLEDGFRPTIDEILRQRALAALERHDLKSAVIESFTSLEIFAEHLYYDGLSDRMKDDEIENLLTSDRNWQLPVRLKDLLKSQFGKSIPEVDNQMWDRWYTNYKIRNDVVHRNFLPTENASTEMLRTNDDMKRILQAIISE